MDMNDVIISLGGVEHISAPCDLTVSDAELQEHINNYVEGVKPTVAQVRAQITVLEQQMQVAQFASIQTQYLEAIQAHLDAGAKSLGYDGILSACSYATSKHLPFSVDGQSCVEWRDNVWLYCYQELDKVKNGTRALPTLEQIISELPARV